MLVKICGFTLVEDAAFAADCGADLLGVVLSTNSPRRAGETQARALLGFGFTQPLYLVFGYDDVDYIEKTFRTLAQPDTRLQVMADHPEIERLLALAPPERIMPSVSAAQKIGGSDISRWEKHPLILFDSHRGAAAGGTGKVFDHTNIAGIKRPYLLAGGLTPDNIAEIVMQVHPPGVDVASGVESRPGIKDREKLKRFIVSAKGVGG